MQRPMPTWGADLSTLDLDNIFYYVKPTDAEGKILGRCARCD